MNHQKNCPTPAPGRPNVSAIARAHGVHRSTVQAWQREGLDLSDADALAARAAAAKGRADSETLVDLKRRKLRAEAARLEAILAREKAELIPAGEVESFLVAITASFRAALKSLCGNLPGELEGLAAPAMQALLVRRTDEILLALSELRFTPKPYGKAKS